MLQRPEIGPWLAEVVDVDSVRHEFAIKADGNELLTNFRFFVDVNNGARAGGPTIKHAIRRRGISICTWRPCLLPQPPRASALQNMGQLPFFRQTCAFLDKLSDRRRCDLRVNEYTAYSRRQLLAKAAIAASRVAPEIAASRIGWNLGARPIFRVASEPLGKRPGRYAPRRIVRRRHLCASVKSRMDARHQRECPL